MSNVVPKDELNKMRHSAAHVLAAASQQLKPETRLGIGPATEDGFFHDIDVDERYTEQDLKKLEKKMLEIKKMDLPITQKQISKDEARQLFKNDPYKLELIEDIEGDTVGISEMGDGFFITLCEGGHVSSTGNIGEFKLTRLAGVYWKGDETKPQLQRIYGIAFPTKKELKEHLALLEEAKKRDHRKFGKELDLFTFSEIVGSGLPMFTARGTMIRNEIQQFIRSLQKEHGYEEVTIPYLAKPDLYKTSGHWDKFRDDIFHVTGKNNAEFVLKPMNCPHHTQIYASKKRSYRDLPQRYCEVTQMYRDEQAGELAGLTRVRSITIDDGHVFCRLDQIEQEIDIIMTLINQFYDVFDFELSFRLSLRDPMQKERYLGDDAVWDSAEEALRKVLTNKSIAFTEMLGEAAFYGPKIDFIARDSLKRDWQLATIQLDFNLPQRFNLTYTDEKGAEKHVVMIHRAISGSLERFMAILLEHYAGNLPLWLSPIQVAVLPISDDQNTYAEKVKEELIKANIRTSLDDRSESIGKKIRDSEIQKVPVMLIIGKKEVEAQTVSVRSHKNGDEGSKKLLEVMEQLREQIEKRQ